MRRIVDGKRYDTRTAEEIGTASRGHHGDFRAWTETLYRTKKGVYFIAGNGGPMTRWGQSSGNESWGDEGILPLTRDEALEWCSTYLDDAEEYEGFFSDIEDA